MKLLNVGFGSFVPVDKIVSIIGMESAPLKRMIQTARNESRTIDATFGRKTRSVIITDSNHLVLSAIQPDTLASRIDIKLENLNE